ncbi:MAG: HPF/RaiA family ribosome-associated protein [Flavipsychrobacter sp.]|nr:HPF/RaiA family ribosome-associated protein [Flavipsychrobacter sp.]
MIVQINTDNNAHLSEGSREQFTETIKSDLNRFAEHLTRVEVHFSDENGPKDGTDDKKCLLEARLEGLQPIAASANGRDFSSALDAALDIMKKNIAKTREKLSSH